jgi:hypothetical protein
MRRTPQPPERQPASTAPNPEPPHEPVAPHHESMSKHSSKRSKKASSKKNIGLIAAAVVIVAVILFGGWSVLNNAGSAGLIDGGRYQAVFLSNGQVYFGKLKVKGDYYVLKDIFYLQSSTVGAASADPQENTAANDVKLIKLGTEVHGPEDEMIIARDQVLFFENLQDEENSTVVKSIKSYDPASSQE